MVSLIAEVSQAAVAGCLRSAIASAGPFHGRGDNVVEAFGDLHGVAGATGDDVEQHDAGQSATPVDGPVDVVTGNFQDVRGAFE